MAKKCTTTKCAMWLVVIGAVNWGLVGLAGLFTDGSNWNVVNLLLGSWAVVENIVYVLVGLSVIPVLKGCKGTCGVEAGGAGNCKGGNCSGQSNEGEGSQM